MHSFIHRSWLFLPPSPVLPPVICPPPVSVAPGSLSACQLVSRLHGANDLVRGTVTLSYMNQAGEEKQEYDFTDDYSIVSQTQPHIDVYMYIYVYNGDENRSTFDLILVWAILIFSACATLGEDTILTRAATITTTQKDHPVWRAHIPGDRRPFLRT